MTFGMFSMLSITSLAQLWVFVDQQEAVAGRSGSRVHPAQQHEEGEVLELVVGHQLAVDRRAHHVAEEIVAELLAPPGDLGFDVRVQAADTPHRPLGIVDRVVDHGVHPLDPLAPALGLPPQHLERDDRRHRDQQLVAELGLAASR